MASWLVRTLRSIGKHGLNAPELSFLTNIVKSQTGQELSPAQEAQNQFNAEEAEKARSFEKEMSDTAYQRQVADMQAAGVNPALAMGGSSSGASTPSGQAASASSVSGISDILGLVASLTMQSKQLRQQRQIAERSLDQQAFSLQTDRMLAESNINKAQSEIQVNNEYREEIRRRCDLLIKQADTEDARAGFIYMQKHLLRQTAQENQIRLRYAEDFENAKTNAEKFRALREEVMYNYEHGVYENEDFVKAQISKAVSESFNKHLEGKKLSAEFVSTQFRNYVDYVTDLCIGKGMAAPGDSFDIKDSEGHVLVSIPLPDTPEQMHQLRMSLGCAGPVSGSGSYSISGFGLSQSQNQGYSYSPGWSR